MTDSNAYAQGEIDSLVAIIGRHAERGRSIVHALEQVAKDRSITAAGRELVRIALDDARAIVAGDEVLPGRRRRAVPIPGCHPGDCAPTLPPPDGEGVKHTCVCEHGRVHVWEADGWKALTHTRERDVS